MSIEELLAAIRSGNTANFTKEDWKKASEHLYSSTKKLESGKTDGKSADELQMELSAITQALQSSPEGKMAMRDILETKQSDRFARKYQPFFNSVLAGADIITSLSQVREANRAARELVRPTLPSAPGIDPALNQAISSAQQGTYDAARAIAPAKQGILDQYLRDINVAGQIGGGQGATYGALAQTAALRRNNSLTGLTPMVDQVRAREQARLDNLIGMRSNLQQQNFRNRLSLADSNLQQYNLDASAAGALGAAGRSNLRQGVGTLVGQVPQLMGRLYNPSFDQYNNYLDKSLNTPNRAQGYQPTPAYQYKFHPEQNLLDLF